MKKLNILIAASEVVPFAKSGGLADVVGALPKALKKLGHNVIVVMPRYYVVDKEKYDLQPLDGSLGVPMGVIGEEWAEVYEGKLPNSEVPIYFIEYDRYFGRKGLYDENGVGYSDNDNRFIFLSRAALQLAKKINFKPDIIHANDWHTAPMPLFLNTHYKNDPHFENAASVISIHNLQHQGKFYKGAIDVLDVGWTHYNIDELQEYDGINLLKGGIVHSNAINAVSQKYADEIQTSEFGWGLESLITHHGTKLFGILNGVDYEEWSPEVDELIPAQYSVNRMKGKKVCKKELQKRFNLPQKANIPLIGLVGRLADQKGISILAESIHKLMEMNIQIVLLGTGEKWAEDFFSEIAKKYPQKFGIFIGYKNDLSHQIEAGSDFFLMPSLFEPCGLNQIYSLSYGTLPIVRATGGLDDTIENYQPYTGIGDGFKFYEASADALIGTVIWAVDTYKNDKKGMKQLIKNAMKKRFSWEIAAQSYVDMYNYSLSQRFKN